MRTNLAVETTEERRERLREELEARRAARRQRDVPLGKRRGDDPVSNGRDGRNDV